MIFSNDLNVKTPFMTQSAGHTHTARSVVNPRQLHSLHCTGNTTLKPIGVEIYPQQLTRTQPDSSHFHLRWNDQVKRMKTGTTP